MALKCARDSWAAYRHCRCAPAKFRRGALGCAAYAFNSRGERVVNEVGELVITEPMPSMPLYFWRDPGYKRYLESYFEMYPGVWCHGDQFRLTRRGTCQVIGRSDATLNRQGVRIGTAEIYRALEQVQEVDDGLIVNLLLPHGDSSCRCLSRCGPACSARRSAGGEDSRAPPRRLLTASRAGSNLSGRCDSLHALGQEARGAGAAHSDGDAAREGGGRLGTWRCRARSTGS